MKTVKIANCIIMMLACLCGMLSCGAGRRRGGPFVDPGELFCLTTPGVRLRLNFNTNTPFASVNGIIIGDSDSAVLRSLGNPDIRLARSQNEEIWLYGDFFSVYIINNKVFSYRISRDSIIVVTQELSQMKGQGSSVHGIDSGGDSGDNDQDNSVADLYINAVPIHDLQSYDHVVGALGFLGTSLPRAEEIRGPVYKSVSLSVDGKIGDVLDINIPYIVLPDGQGYGIISSIVVRRSNIEAGTIH